ncbi:prenylcysteine oxidase 1 [Pogona vitticeps]
MAAWVSAAAAAFLLLFLLQPPGGGVLSSSASQGLRRPPAKIGVIGAGIGGTSAAYFLRQKFGRDVQIDVFEKGEVGGRLATLNVEGKYYEAGGTIIHPLNLHMKHFVKELGLSVSAIQDGLRGFYSGEELVFEESGWYIWNFLKLLWHYGLNGLRMYLWEEEILDKFMRIYRYQSHDYAFSTSEALLHALGGSDFLQRLNQTMDESMQRAGFSQKFINEIVTPVMRYNYGQGASINGFVGVVALTGTDPGLWSIEGGNKRACSGLLEASKAQLTPGTVLSVEGKTRQEGRSGGAVKFYEVMYNSATGLTSDSYDIIVVATPLHPKIASIAFHNIKPSIPGFSRPYEPIVTTFIHGQINASLFGYKDPSQFTLSDVFTMENPNAFFYSLSVVSPVQNTTDPFLGSHVWKAFSAESLTKEQLNLLFSSYDAVEEKKWLAYPHYSPPEKCPPVILHDHMYYLNSIECIASAMEMSAISAKNVALLAYHRWYNKVDMIDQEDLHERLKTEL